MAMSNVCSMLDIPRGICNNRTVQATRVRKQVFVFNRESYYNSSAQRESHGRLNNDLFLTCAVYFLTHLIMCGGGDTKSSNV
jgi:hypothetical protein